jgi:hypothetical protein
LEQTADLIGGPVHMEGGKYDGLAIRCIIAINLGNSVGYTADFDPSSLVLHLQGFGIGPPSRWTSQEGIEEAGLLNNE